MSNWPTELFVKNPELFQGDLEERVETAPDEVDKLLSFLNKENFEPENSLDLACGIGRHSIELAKRGYKVSGLDISEKYIQEAQKRTKKEGVAEKTEFRVGDMRKISDLYPEGEFRGILNLFTSFGYYDDETSKKILRDARKIVESGGFFVLETKNRDHLLENFEEKSFRRCENSFVLEKRNFDYDTSRVEMSWSYFKKTNGHYELLEEIKIDHRVWSLHELKSLFSKTGWRVKSVYSGLRQEKKEKIGEMKDFLVVAQKN